MFFFLSLYQFFFHLSLKDSALKPSSLLSWNFSYLNSISIKTEHLEAVRETSPVSWFLPLLHDHNYKWEIWGF